MEPWDFTHVVCRVMVPPEGRRSNAWNTARLRRLRTPRSPLPLPKCLVNNQVQRPANAKTAVKRSTCKILFPGFDLEQHEERYMSVLCVSDGVHVAYLWSLYLCTSGLKMGDPKRNTQVGRSTKQNTRQ